MRYLPVVLAIVILITGCVAKQPSIGRHDYTVSVVNTSGEPVEGAIISGNCLDRPSHKEKPISCTTSQKGQCVFQVETNAGYYRDYINNSGWKWGFASMISVNAEKLEYFTTLYDMYEMSYDVERTDYGSIPPISVPEQLNIKLIPLKEVLCRQEFVSSRDFETAHKNIEKTIRNTRELIDVKGAGIKSLLIAEYKNNNYIGIDIDYPIVFNSEKSSRYENVRDIIDAVIRGVAKIMDTNFYHWCVSGFKIEVHAERRSFINSRMKRYDPSAEVLNLNIYLLKDMVHKYKEDNITGQHLIDSSIVLLNGERIDVKMH